MRRLIAITLIVASVAVGQAAAQGPPPPSLGAKILPSLVKIISVCGPTKENRIASGFVFGTKHQVVTDMHVVAGCEPDLTVLYFVTGAQAPRQVVRHAAVSKVLRTADLALLTVTDPPDAPPLPVAAKPVSPEQWVVAWGFPLGIQAPTDTRLQVTFSNDLFPELKYTLDDTALAALQALHFPSLSSRVLHLSGPLQPGDSGAPVVNDAGEVVGIGSGGLQHGAASISWAMRSEYLRQLLDSTESSPAPGDASPLFAYVHGADPASTSHAADNVAAAGPSTVSCGGPQLVYRGTRSLADLLATADDRGAIRRLAGQYKTTVAALSATPYAIWIEPSSGAAVVVPADLALQPSDGFCRAAVGDAGITLLVRVTALPRNPQTPEWAFAVGRARWQSLVALSKAAGTGLTFMGARASGWSRQHISNDALIRRSVMSGRDGIRVYRADLAGRGAAVSVGVVARDTEDSAADGERLPWLRALAAVELASFPPPDQTQSLGASADTSADATTGTSVDDAADDPAPSLGAAAFPEIYCGQRFLRLSPVPTVGALAAALSARDALAATVRERSGVPLDQVATAQLDEWGEASAGLVVLLPRGWHPEQVSPRSRCVFAPLAEIGPRFVIAAYNGEPAQRWAEFRDGLAQELAVTIGTLQQAPVTARADMHVRRWLGDVRDAKGNREHLAVVEQVRETRSVFAALVAPESADPRQPALLYGWALAGLLLSPDLASP